jgi:hypothetical protein
MHNPAIVREGPGAFGDPRSGTPVSSPDPVRAGVFAFVGLSLGQFYCGQPLRGLCWGALGALLFLILRDHILAAPLGIFFLAACAIDAWSTAGEIRQGTLRYRGISGFFWAEVMLGLSLVMATGIAAVARALQAAAVLP